MRTCLNCGHRATGNFCSNCGQKASVKRITLAVLLEDIFHFFTHLEKGFLYTTWNFLIRPGITALNYLEGKRKKYQQPVSYFLIWTGLYILVHNSIINHFHFQVSKEDSSGLDLMEQANIFLRTHFTIFVIPILLVSSFFIYFILARPQFNFIEIVTLCLYGGGTYFMLLLVSDIVLGVIFKTNTISTGVFVWQTILSSVYNFWFSFDIFKRTHVRFLWLRLICVALLVSVCGWFLLVFLPLAWINISR